jgi:hypothetical protein
VTVEMKGDYSVSCNLGNTPPCTRARREFFYADLLISDDWLSLL